MSKNGVVTGVMAGALVAGLSFGLMGLTSGCQTGGCPYSAKTGNCPYSAKKEMKQMGNAEFYKDGKFDAAKAKQAYYDLMKKFGYPVFAELTRADGPFWATDFGKGSFMTYGMGGVFWCNEKKESYFGHEIYLLAGQSIPEHRHLPTQDTDGKTIACKTESWQVRHGSVYGFSEVGEPNLDKFPEAKAMLANFQVPNLKSVHVEKWVADGKVYKLAGPETWHFMQAGPEGAIVLEFASYHDGAGLRFSVPGVSL